MTTLADLLVKAGTFAKQWRDQCGCNAQVLDELADAIEGYLATARTDLPRFANELAPGSVSHQPEPPADDPFKQPITDFRFRPPAAEPPKQATRTVPGRRVGGAFEFDVRIEVGYEDLPDGRKHVRNSSAVTLEVKRTNGALVLFPPTAVAILEPGDTVQTPTLGKHRFALMSQSVTDGELYYAKRLGSAAHRAGADFLWVTRLPDGRALYLLPWSGPGVQLSIGVFGAAVYTDTWNYHPGHTDDGWRAVLSWDGHGEPEGWTRHPSSGRVRPDGTAATEAVER